MKKNAQLTYLLIGVSFGLWFPILSTLWTISSRQLPLFSLRSFVLVQASNPLQWMIDTAPVFLGLLSFYVGRKQDQVLKLNRELELRVRERDRVVEQLKTVREGLEQHLNKQVVELRAAAQVARQAAAIHDLNVLLNRAVHLISDEFGFYHAGIFILDSQGEYAILQAANSEGGQRMLQRGHKLRVGQVGIVGYVASKGEARIAHDVGADAVYFDNPDLPQTRSEAALPLTIHHKLIGVLDVQSVQAAAFSQEDVEILQTLADQIALAIQNAQLLAKSQQSIQELERLYSSRLYKSWEKQLEKQAIAYRYDHLGVKTLPQDELVKFPEDETVLKVPIQLHKQSLGSLVLRKEPGTDAWTTDEKQLVEEAMRQVALALENARLLEEVRRRASREEQINLITNQVRGSAHPETILQNTIRELGKALGATRTFIQVGTPPRVSAELNDRRPTESTASN